MGEAKELEFTIRFAVDLSPVENIVEDLITRLERLALIVRGAATGEGK